LLIISAQGMRDKAIFAIVDVCSKFRQILSRLKHNVFLLRWLKFSVATQLLNLFDHCRILVTFPVNKCRPAAFGFKMTVGDDSGDRSVNHFAGTVSTSHEPISAKEDRRPVESWASFADHP
jgi:hypothetical protein